MDHVYAVIMAGGGGTRLWPISRKNRPKQLLPLVEDRTLFQTTFERLNGLFLPEQVLVVTVEAQAKELQAQVPSIPLENYLIEPTPRGTASVVGFAAAVLKKRDPQAVMVILPSDHYIRNKDLFHLLLHIAVDVAQKGYLVTLGITPTYPAIAYGYIQRGEIIPGQFPYPVYHVKRFKEKPTESQARKMIAHGDHSWNSGMFIWRVDRILEEFDRQMPDLKSALDKISDTWGTPNQEVTLRTIWPGLRVEMIDYGIMERAKQVALLPAGGLEWSDVGSWDSLFDVLLPDAQGNIVFSSHHIPVDTHNSLVYGNKDDTLIVTIGLDDLIIVHASDVLLICKKDQAQKVRQVVASLKTSDKEHYT
jgi:mannose-1-phosphate guanylyltransferase